jgi:aspartate beta-hydroxylase
MKMAESHTMSSANEQVERLVKAAGNASKQGDMARAETLWQSVLQQAPNHPDAHFALGFHAFQRKHLDIASNHFRAALLAQTTSAGFKLTVARALQQIGDADGMMLALDATLATDPYHLPAILAKAKALAKQGRSAGAAEQFNNALKIVGPQFNWPEALRGDLLEASHYCAAEAIKKEAWLNAAVQDVRQRHPAQNWTLFDESVSIMAGRTKPYQQEPVMLNVPRLPAQTFYEREQFPFLKDLEAQTDLIRDEMINARASAPHLFAPYVQYRPGEPVNQWAELNHKDAWSRMFIWKDGILHKEAADLCPVTTAAIGAIPLAKIDGFCPTVMFSALAPGARIPPHTGETNARVIVHLPLIVPDRCKYRVGYDWREWEVGKCLIFDDSIEHEAINESDELRVVLIFDLWNPYLSHSEREMVKALLDAQKQYGLP